MLLEAIDGMTVIDAVALVTLATARAVDIDFPHQVLLEALPLTLVLAWWSFGGVALDMSILLSMSSFVLKRMLVPGAGMSLGGRIRSRGHISGSACPT